MKKLKYVVILILFLIPMVVKGDMAAPMTSYKVRISNPEGALTYEWDSEQQSHILTGKKLNYDEQYNIIYEQIINNELYGLAAAEKEVGYIKLSDTSPLEVNIEKYKNDISVKYYVFDSSCYIYKGPSKIYGKVEPEVFLKEGTIIESNYYDDMWMYIDYNGVKGWVYKYSYNIFENGETAGMTYVIEDDTYNRKIYTMKDIELYKSPKTDEKNGKVIPKGTMLDYKYEYSMQPHTPNYYVSYNGISGWIKAEFDEEYTIINIAYYNASTLRVRKEGGLSLYSEPNKDANELIIIPNGAELTSIYSLEESHSTPWYYVSYDGKSGWIYTGMYSYIEYISKEENPPVEELEPIVTIGEQEKEEALESKKDITAIIIYYLLGALALCITAIVTLLLVNKKKAKKENKIVKEEPKIKNKTDELPIKNDK